MEPIVVEFDVDCSPEHAFRIWTERTALWWPRSHTVTADSDLEVVFEPRAGGRIYERAPDGAEHEWGEVRVWDPPNRVEYLWHLFFDRSEGTDVTLTFEPVDGGTRVRLHQDGFDRLPDAVGAPRRDRTQGAWAEITRLYREALL
jgi:uncharacterized protein YndB with AHSA1/START domain